MVLRPASDCGILLSHFFKATINQAMMKPASRPPMNPAGLLDETEAVACEAI